MDVTQLPTIEVVNQRNLVEDQKERYTAILQKEGLNCWFNLDLSKLLSHILPLKANPVPPKNPRLKLLYIIVDPAVSNQCIQKIYKQLILSQDLEAAAAAIGAAVQAIWLNGYDFQRFDFWYQQSGRLLETESNLSPLAKSYTMGYRGLMEMLWWGDIDVAIRTLQEAVVWAEKARSNALKVFFGAMLGHCYAWYGDLSRAEVLNFDIIPLTDLADIPDMCKALFEMVYGITHVATGQIKAGLVRLQKTIDQPHFHTSPPVVRLLVYGFFLIAAAVNEDTDIMALLAIRLQNEAISKHNDYNHGFTHFCLSIACLTTSKPYKAFVHASEAMGRARKSNIIHGEQMTALVLGQSLADMGKTEEAMAHFKSWLARWQKSGFRILAVHGALELANLYLKKRQHKLAGEYYARAFTYLPPQNELTLLFRPLIFLRHIQQALDPSLTQPVTHVDEKHATIRIYTFGDLQVICRGRTLGDRKWKGRRTHRLLKTLIVLGSETISADRLMDLLWPEAEGDKASHNLKVAVYRLRKALTGNDPSAPPWLIFNNKKVTISPTSCWIDCRFFQRVIQSYDKGVSDPDALAAALSLYRDDFLIHDVNEPWLFNHRETLMDQYVIGAIAYTNACHSAGDYRSGIPYIEKASTLRPIHEPLHALLMESYLKLGYPSQALQVYHQICNRLKESLDIEPGDMLKALAYGLIKK